MDTLDNSTPSAQPAPQADLTELRERYESLRQLVISVLILLVMISGAFNLFLLRQYKFVRAELATIRPQATQMIADYQKTSGPAMDEFVKKIREYGRTHADFAPIMNKYSLNQPVPATSAPAPAIPSPAPKK